MHSKTLSATAFFAFTVFINGQGVPPAQGPPLPSGTVIRDLPVNALTAQLRDTLQKKLVEANAAMAARTDARAKISLSSLVRYGPYRVQTQFTDRPNHFYVEVRYILQLKIDDIQWADGTINCNVPKGYQHPRCPEAHGEITWRTYPWSRNVSVSARLNSFCSGWETGAGKIKIIGESDPPYLDPNSSPTEAVVNFFLGGHLVPFVNSKIQQGLRAPGGGVSQTLDSTKCSSLAADRPDPNTDKFDAIQWSEPGLRRPDLMPGITVRPTKVKRLQARNFWENNAVLYEPVESPGLEIYAGFGHRFYQLPPMTEGQEVALAVPPFNVYPKPTNSTSLVVIANMNHSLYITDSAFQVFPSSVKHGHGTQTIQVRKTFWEAAKKGKKPVKYTVPAYEITFEVVAPFSEATLLQ